MIANWYPRNDSKRNGLVCVCPAKNTWIDDWNHCHGTQSHEWLETWSIGVWRNKWAWMEDLLFCEGGTQILLWHYLATWVGRLVGIPPLSLSSLSLSCWIWWRTVLVVSTSLSLPHPHVDLTHGGILLLQGSIDISNLKQNSASVASWFLQEIYTLLTAIGTLWQKPMKLGLIGKGYHSSPTRLFYASARFSASSDTGWHKLTQDVSVIW
jgi:hypothetical protein